MTNPLSTKELAHIREQENDLTPSNGGWSTTGRWLATIDARDAQLRQALETKVNLYTRIDNQTDEIVAKDAEIARLMLNERDLLETNVEVIIECDRYQAALRRIAEGSTDWHSLEARKALEPT